MNPETANAALVNRLLELTRRMERMQRSMRLIAASSRSAMRDHADYEHRRNAKENENEGSGV
ncbi:MAG: hypothetical protein E6I87_08435 [Chloroflexi bacterium]|nr:MAG: hypothetical protein E6I87_08435 [Chloroflexota bacterium]